MANNDRLKQIISNIQILKDLTNSMIDSEMYPVSFFSQAFDLVQKIQSDFHTLEADQVEMFAAQMKKHETLLLSIHQQMRNISPDTQTQNPTPPIAQPVPSERPQKPNTTQTESIPQAKIPEPKEEKSKKGSFFNRLGIHKDEKDENIGNNSVDNIAKQPEAPEKKQVKETKITPEVKKTTPVVEEPIKVPVKKTVIENSPSQEAPLEKKALITPPTPKITRSVKPTPVETQKPEPVSAPAEANAPQSLNEAIEKKKLADLRKAFSLNDRFRYRKELFGGSEEAMSKVITILNNKESFKECAVFLEQKLHWDFSDPTVKDFIKILELRFL